MILFAGQLREPDRYLFVAYLAPKRHLSVILKLVKSQLKGSLERLMVFEEPIQIVFF